MNYYTDEQAKNNPITITFTYAFMLRLKTQKKATYSCFFVSFQYRL